MNEITPEKIRDAVRCASFMQRVKLAYWKQNQGKLCVAERDLDEILILAFKDLEDSLK